MKLWIRAVPRQVRFDHNRRSLDRTPIASPHRASLLVDIRAQQTRLRIEQRLSPTHLRLNPVSHEVLGKPDAVWGLHVQVDEFQILPAIVEARVGYPPYAVRLSAEQLVAGLSDQPGTNDRARTIRRNPDSDHRDQPAARGEVGREDRDRDHGDDRDHRGHGDGDGRGRRGLAPDVEEWADGVLTWLEATLRVVRRIPANVRFERERIQRAVRLERRLRAEHAAATWTCRLHGDAWRRPSGALLVLNGQYVMPLSDADAEDFHGYDASRR